MIYGDVCGVKEMLAKASNDMEKKKSSTSRCALQVTVFTKCYALKPHNQPVC